MCVLACLELHSAPSSWLSLYSKQSAKPTSNFSPFDHFWASLNTRILELDRAYISSSCSSSSPFNTLFLRTLRDTAPFRCLADRGAINATNKAPRHQLHSSPPSSPTAHLIYDSSRNGRTNGQFTGAQSRWEEAESVSMQPSCSLDRGRLANTLLK